MCSGHSPDSISILLLDELAQSRAVFTGDTLFVGDVGRPDLREEEAIGGHRREALAAQLYHSTRTRLMTLPGATRVYPAHGPGSLCGKTTSPDLDSTIAKELKTNYALQPMSQEEFIKVLLEDQPFVPKYFGHDVKLNKQGAPSFEDSIRAAGPTSCKPRCPVWRCWIWASYYGVSEAGCTLVPAIHHLFVGDSGSTNVVCYFEATLQK
ncbi:hypothetical protein IC235_06695 [Hymenobacter sp. BT664]|uniref:Metallo-beta-lactamase domain-containing protein n=1 Tax=Hymenobacter montanus TaxID=2771359 RepID=A0A927GIN0_9BACT|nr:hypothetical protein [Hymenobacter montanus]MBD2767577.1 hypothetical protein [Hymenobacter montanus]